MPKKPAPRTITMTSEGGSTDCDEKESDAAQEALQAILVFEEARIRKKIKLRTHRKPTGSAVENELRVCINSKIPIFRYLEFIRDYQNVTKTAPKDWLQNENIRVMEAASQYFAELTKLIDPPKGRPRNTKQNRLGLIASRMMQHAPADSNEDIIGGLVQKFLKSEKPYRMGIAARRERDNFVRDGMSKADADKKLNSLNAATDYMRDWDDDEKAELIERRMPPGKLIQKFIDLGGKEQQYSAFKMRLSRERKKLHSL